MRSYGFTTPQLFFIIGYRQFYNAGSDEEEELATAVVAVEEADLNGQSNLDRMH